MQDEDTMVKSKISFVPGQSLDDLSVDEIGNIITRLQSEILRLEAARKDKSSHLSAAEALFSRS